MRARFLTIWDATTGTSIKSWDKDVKSDSYDPEAAKKVLAAAGLIALEEGPKRLQDDHANAQVLAKRLAAVRGIALDAAKVQTNIVIFGLAQSGITAAEFLKRLADRQVLAVPVDSDRVRMVTHLDVTRTDVEAAATAVEQVMEAI